MLGDGDPVALPEASAADGGPWWLLAATASPVPTGVRSRRGLKGRALAGGGLGDSLRVAPHSLAGQRQPEGGARQSLCSPW